MLGSVLGSPLFRETTIFHDAQVSRYLGSCRISRIHGSFGNAELAAAAAAVPDNSNGTSKSIAAVVEAI